MEQSPPLEACNPSSSQEIPLLLCNTKIRYHVHTSTSLDHILSQLTPCSIFIFRSVLIYLPSAPMSLKWPLPSGFGSKF